MFSVRSFLSTHVWILNVVALLPICTMLAQTMQSIELSMQVLWGRTISKHLLRLGRNSSAEIEAFPP
jgi:hypothetical protein